MQCKICQANSEAAFCGLLLGQYQVTWYRCPDCGFMQTEDPYWLTEAYSSAISDLDLGPVNRALTGARLVEGLILSCFDADGSFLDWGGGYGVFTRLMRDRGYDFHWNDRYCENLFAKHFVAVPGRHYELMTCFEVFEHLVDPLADIAAMLGWSRNILFTTEFPPHRLTSATDWWYLTPEHGQHVSIWSRAALEHIAGRFGLHLSSDNRAVHLLSQRPISPRLFRVIVRDGRLAALMRAFGRRRHRRSSLLMSDFRAVTGWNA